MTAPIRVKALALRADQVLLGNTFVFRQLLKEVERMAVTSHAVLIVGERGTGKELIARAIHDWSGRPGKFVSRNVSAVTADLFESEFVGHVRGAFTGAIDDRVGYFAEADNGTVFLDEIEALPHAVQPKLLRVIDLKEFRRVGGREDQRSNFRVVAATNEDLYEMTRNGRFRHDLYDRLRAMIVRMPSLRERKEDIPLLVQYYLRQEKIHDEAHLQLSPPVVALLTAYSWPGNIRELKHVSAWLATFIETWPLSVTDVQRALHEYGVPEQTVANVAARVNTDHEVECWQYREALKDAAGNVIRAAATLGVDRSTVYRKMHTFGLTKYGTVDDTARPE